MIPILRPTIANINLNALKRNILKARTIIATRNNKNNLANNTKIFLLVKANAYGHDAQKIATYVQKENLVDFLGVASIEEGLILRQNGINLPILVLGSIFPFDCFEWAIKNKLSIAVASVKAAKALVKIAEELKITAMAHIKQETGMGRIGSRRPSAMEILRILSSSSFVKVEGVFSHFACANVDDNYSQQQIAYFKEFLEQAKSENLSVGIRHLSASTAFLTYPEAQFDMVRLGHLAYGLEEGFEPILELKSKVVFIKDVRKGARISYNSTFTCARPSKIATIPVGYGDGYHRCLSNKAQVEILGKLCPIIGNITMDMMMVDITDLGDIPIGTDVILIGANITADSLAKLANTIDYELLTNIALRVPRITIEE